jgi:hypothetical protein
MIGVVAVGRDIRAVDLNALISCLGDSAYSEELKLSLEPLEWRSADFEMAGCDEVPNLIRRDGLALYYRDSAKYPMQSGLPFPRDGAVFAGFPVNRRGDMRSYGFGGRRAQPHTAGGQNIEHTVSPVCGQVTLSLGERRENLKASDFLREPISKAADEIIPDVFNQHPQAQGMFRFVLSQPLPSRSYCRQDETDWNFVHRLLESEGLYGFWQQADDGKSHTLVITDRLETLVPLSPEQVNFYRAGTGSETDALMQWSGDDHRRRLRDAGLCEHQHSEYEGGQRTELLQ